MRKLLICADCLQLLTSATPCLAEETQPVAPLIAGGYEIKAVILNEHGGSTHDQAQILVTLQKGPSIAVCTFLVGWWQSLLEKAMANPDVCIVRKF
jgi:hypothetical protein